MDSSLEDGNPSQVQPAPFLVLQDLIDNLKKKIVCNTQKLMKFFYVSKKKKTQKLTNASSMLFFEEMFLLCCTPNDVDVFQIHAGIYKFRSVLQLC